MLGRNDRCIARSMRSASRVGSVITDPRVVSGSPEMGPPGPPPGDPPGDPPRDPPARARENFRENFRGENSRGRAGRARARPGPPREAPKWAPKWALFGPPKRTLFGGIYICFILQTPPKGGPRRGPKWTPPGDPPGGSPGARPGGEKSAHFFGYLITLPVGTVWALFFPPPGQAGFGTVWRAPPGGVFIAPYGVAVPWAGALGRRASDGTR